MQRRWKKELESGARVVYYDVGGITVQVYNPDTYFAIGEMIETAVRVSVYATKSGPRYSLIIPGRQEGEF